MGKNHGGLWHYKVENSKGVLEDYTGRFESEEDLIEYYNTSGKHLEKLTGRTFILHYKNINMEQLRKDCA